MKKIFCWMLHTMIKGWYPYCYKCWHRNLSMYIQMFILLRIAFILERIQMIQFHHKKMNKYSKTGILMKLTKKCGNYCKQLVDQDLNFKKICVNVCTDITPLPPVFILSLNVIIEYPHSIFSKDTQPFNFIKCNII